MCKSLGVVALVLGLLLSPQGLFAELIQSLEGADSLNIGNVFQLYIKSSNPIKEVQVPDTLQSFSILSKHSTDKSGKEWRIEMAPLKTGALSFPRLQVLPEAPEQAPDSTDAFRVYVLSVLAEGDTLLRDIKPLERYSWQLPFWAYLLWGLVTVGLVIYLLIRRPPRTKQQPVPPVIKEELLSAWDSALSELSELEASGLTEAGEWMRFYFRLSEICRRFLERNYRFAAMEMTSQEISSILRNKQINRHHEIIAFIWDCDRVKFAKHLPEKDSALKHLGWLKDYLQGFTAKETGDNHA